MLPYSTSLFTAVPWQRQIYEFNIYQENNSRDYELLYCGVMFQAVSGRSLTS